MREGESSDSEMGLTSKVLCRMKGGIDGDFKM